MPELSSDGTAPRRIKDALDVGCANNGQDVRLNIRMEDGTNEWFDIQHSKVGRFVSALMFGSSVAKQHRPTATALGNPLPELSTVIDIRGLNASAAPGSDFVALRMVLGEGVALDFRIPLSAVPAMQEKVSQAVALAKSGKPSSAH